MRADPRLSIIIPTRDEASCIARLLGDLAPLRAMGHELILVDGGSADDTSGIAAPLVDRVIHAERGRAVQMNAGARLATGDILWFLHADTRVPPGAAQRLIDSCIDGGSVWGRFDLHLSGTRPILRVVSAMMNLRSRLTGVATGDQGIFVVREQFVSAGGFPAIPLMEDIALSKALRRIARPTCIRRPRLQTSSRRWERHGVMRTIALMWRLRLAYALGVPPHQLARHYQ